MPKQKYTRPQNGKGQSGMVNLELKLTDPLEARAWEMAKKLAMPHGRRKGLLVQFLNALADYEERTGVLPTADSLAASVIASAFLGRPAFAPQQPAMMMPPEAPIVHKPIEMVKAPPSDEDFEPKFVPSGLASRFKPVTPKRK